MILVVGAEKKQQLPEIQDFDNRGSVSSGISGFNKRRTRDRPIIHQVPVVVAIDHKLVESGFKPAWKTKSPALPLWESKDTGKENQAHFCAIHRIVTKKFTNGNPKEYS